LMIASIFFMKPRLSEKRGTSVKRGTPFSTGRASWAMGKTAALRREIAIICPFFRHLRPKNGQQRTPFGPTAFRGKKLPRL
ncbi:MAG: hypothetical protein ACM3Q1_04485, partial [Bacteroidales bacterium]